jgi:hypothetical protein
MLSHTYTEVEMVEEMNRERTMTEMEEFLATDDTCVTCDIQSLIPKGNGMFVIGKSYNSMIPYVPPNTSMSFSSVINRLWLNTVNKNKIQVVNHPIVYNSYSSSHYLDENL